jgi:hypothetical protein
MIALPKGKLSGQKLYNKIIKAFEAELKDGLIPRAMYTGSLGVFPQRIETKVPSRNTA